MLYRIIEAEARPDYRLWIRFADGVEGEVDLSALVGRGVFDVWSDRRFFEQVFIDPDTGTVAWPGGLDLAPDALHRDIAAISAT